METESSPNLKPSDKEYVDKNIFNLRNPKVNEDGTFEYPNEEVRRLGSTISFGETQESIYAVESLLEIINQAPTDISKDIEEKAFTRTFAIEILNYTLTFENSYNNKPELVKEIVKSITERRLKFDRDISFPNFPTPTDFHYREREITEIFFERIVDLIPDKQIQEKIFSCLVVGTGLRDFNIAVREHDLMIQMLKKAATEYNDLDLFENYINILSKREDSFDYTNEYDYRAQYNIDAIYSSIFSLYPELPIEMRTKVNKELLEKIIHNAKHHPDEKIRYRHISALSTFIDKKGTVDEYYLDEHLDYEIEILNTLVNIIKKQSSEISMDEIPYYKPVYISYKTVLKMLDIYTEGVRNNLNNFYQKAQEKYEEEYIEALNTVVNNIPENEHVKAQILSSLNKFINIEALNDPKHPLLIPAKSFLSNYYSNIRNDDLIEPNPKKVKVILQNVKRSKNN
jgi:hypothetical protein